MSEGKCTPFHVVVSFVAFLRHHIFLIVSVVEVAPKTDQVLRKYMLGTSSASDERRYAVFAA